MAEEAYVRRDPMIVTMSLVENPSVAEVLYGAMGDYAILASADDVREGSHAGEGVESDSRRLGVEVQAVWNAESRGRGDMRDEVASRGVVCMSARQSHRGIYAKERPVQKKGSFRKEGWRRSAVANGLPSARRVVGCRGYM